MKKHKYTFFGTFVALILAAVSFIFDLDFFEKIVSWLASLEQYEIDELIIPVLIIFTCVMIDLLRRQRAQKVELEKVKIYQAMLSSTHHILNNFLNQMQLFKITAQDTPDFDPEVLALYDEMIAEAKAQIEALSSISDINDTEIYQSISLTAHLPGNVLANTP